MLRIGIALGVASILTFPLAWIVSAALELAAFLSTEGFKAFSSAEQNGEASAIFSQIVIFALIFALVSIFWKPKVSDPKNTVVDGLLTGGGIVAGVAYTTFFGWQLYSADHKQTSLADDRAEVVAFAAKLPFIVDEFGENASGAIRSYIGDYSQFGIGFDSPKNSVIVLIDSKLEGGLRVHSFACVKTAKIDFGEKWGVHYCEASHWR